MGFHILAKGGKNADLVAEFCSRGCYSSLEPLTPWQMLLLLMSISAERMVFPPGEGRQSGKHYKLEKGITEY